MRANTLASLAKAIIYRTVVTLVRRYHFELFETTREDVEVVRDNLLGAVKPGSQGVRVKLARRETDNIPLSLL